MSIYNMADTFFVSQLGTSAGGAVGIVFPIMTIIQSLGFTIAIGASSMVSRTLGEKTTRPPIHMLPQLSLPHYS
jgi:Na+-driven multidrug efflux pump